MTEDDDRKKEEEHVAKALNKRGYPPWTIDRIKHDMEKSLKDEAKKAKNTKQSQGMVVVPYVKGLSELGICKNSKISGHRHS